MTSSTERSLDYDQEQRSQDDEKDLGLNPSYAVAALDKSVNLFYPFCKVVIMMISQDCFENYKRPCLLKAWYVISIHKW